MRVRPEEPADHKAIPAGGANVKYAPEFADQAGIRPGVAQIAPMS